MIDEPSADDVKRANHDDEQHHTAFTSPPFVIPAAARPPRRTATHSYPSYPLDRHTQPQHCMPMTAATPTTQHDVHVRAGVDPTPASTPLKHLSTRLSFDLLDTEAAAKRAARIERARLVDSALWDATAARTPLHLLSETFLIVRLAFSLWSYLGFGWRWSLHLVQLIAYATLLMPGFAQMVLFYLASSRVLRSIPYGTKPRNRLDLYLPPHHWRQADEGLKPVVVFVTGGAWTIGYKAWGSLLGRRLSKSGCIVACLDYRNFPQGTMSDMLEDVNTGIAWVLRRIQYYGGDPANVTVVGQSCGAQLSSLAITIQAEQQLLGKRLPGGTPAWDPRTLCAFVGVSGVYNVHDMADYLHSRGLYRPLFERIQSLEGQPALKVLSPSYIVLDLGAEYSRLLPPVVLLHGSDDRCVPSRYAEQFAEALNSIGARVQLKMYKGETHTSPLIENPLRGGRDMLQDDILRVVLGREVRTNHPAMCPALLISLAARVNPF